MRRRHLCIDRAATLLRPGGNLAQPRHVFGRLDPPLHRVQQLALRGRDDRGGQGGYAVLQRGGAEVVGIDLDRHVVRRQFGDHRRLAEDLGLHAFADAAPGGPKVDQHQPVRLAGQALCTFESGFPTDRLLCDTHRR